MYFVICTKNCRRSRRCAVRTVHGGIDLPRCCRRDSRTDRSIDRRALEAARIGSSAPRERCRALGSRTGRERIFWIADASRVIPLTIDRRSAAKALPSRLVSPQRLISVRLFTVYAPRKITIHRRNRRCGDVERGPRVAIISILVSIMNAKSARSAVRMLRRALLRQQIHLSLRSTQVFETGM